jgi:hypothetical protein
MVACGDAGGGASRSLSGNWSGNVNDSVAGRGTVTLSISQSGNSFVGTWQAVFAEGVNSGSLQGFAQSDSSVVIQLHPSNPSACPYNVVANWSGNALSGNYSAFNCSQNVSGTLNLQKQ